MRLIRRILTASKHAAGTLAVLFLWLLMQLPLAAIGPLPTLSENRVWAPAVSDQSLSHAELFLSQEQHRSNAPPTVLFASDCSVGPARTGGGDRGGLNIFRHGDETATTGGGWREGDRFLHLPNQGTPRANWAQNSGRLRQEMRRVEPIFDSYRNPTTGAQIPAGQTPTSGGRFLNAERQLLESRGWMYSPQTGAYHPPGN